MRHRLGNTGANDIYLAEDAQLGRYLMLKLIDAERNYDPRAVAQLENEARLLARIDHPNVAAVHDFGLFGCDICLVLEHFGRYDLPQWLAGGRRTRAEIRDVLVQVGRGLAAAHASGVIHRDLRPQVVRVDDRRRVRLIDFGRGRGLDPESDAWELDEPDFDGHAEYMAPEARTSGRRDALADQYSFCVIAWEALTGKRPGSNPTPSSWGSDAGLLRVLARGLASAPEDRWPDMERLVDALEHTPPRRAGFAVVAVLLVALAGFGWPGVRVDPAAPASQASVDAIELALIEAQRARLDGEVERAHELLTEAERLLEGVAEPDELLRAAVALERARISAMDPARESL